MLKVKEWKALQIIHESNRYDGKYWLEVKRTDDIASTYLVEDGCITFTGNIEVLKETEKAINVNIDGWKTWIPKSVIVA